MRVAYVCADPGVPVFGSKGCSVHVQEVLRALLRQGCHVDLFARRIGGDVPAGLEQVAVHELNRFGKTDARAREQGLIAANRELSIRLAQAGPFDLVYERYALWSSAAMQSARDAGTPSVLEVNAPLIDEQSTHRELVAIDDAQRISSEAFGAADVLLAVSRGVAEYLQTFSGAGGKIHVVSNGVDADRFLEPAPRSPRKFTAGFVGTLRPWHGMNILGEAFSRFHEQHPQAELLIVGDGPASGELIESLSDVALSATKITGHVPPAEVPRYLQRMDVAVAPYSSDQPCYFSPLKIFEYMAAAVPVVASRVGDIPTIIQHGVSGLLCRPGDPLDLAAALSRIHDDARLADKLGANAARRVRQNFSWSGVVRRVFELARLGDSDLVAAELGNMA